MPRVIVLSVVLATILLLQGNAAAPLQAENWPGWRGVRGDGTNLEKQIPVRWSATENIAWKIKTPYVGHASPIIWNDRLYLVGSDKEQTNRMLVALDRKTGKTLWETAVVNSPLEKIHQLNSHASSTPATDGERIYVSFLDHGQMLVAAYDLDGKELWRVQPGAFSSVHGYCSSPVLFEDEVIINGDHDGDSFLVALDRVRGTIRWKTPRENRTRSYCTPIIREIDGRMQMMLSGNKCVASYDPRNGSRQWIIDGPTEQFVASLAYSHGLLFITGGFPDKHILAVDPRGNGNVTNSHIVWRHERHGVSYVPSPVASGDYFLVAADNGIASCYEASTGKIQWQERLGRHYSASLVTADGLAYFVDDDSITKVVKPGPQLEVLATNELGDHCYASPAISQGHIYLRGETYLYSIGPVEISAGGN